MTVVPGSIPNMILSVTKLFCFFVVKVQHIFKSLVQLNLKQASYKQIWVLIIKLSIVIGASYFIYQHTAINGKFPKEELLVLLKNKLFENLWIPIAFIGMTLLNWLLEIAKWQVLSGVVQKSSYAQAAKESLSSHTLSIITPFKTGEYVGKAMYYPKSLRKKIVLLNFIGNATQLFFTLLFGMIGLVFFIKSFDIEVHPHKIRRIAYVIVFLTVSLFAGNKLLYGKGGSYQKAISFFKKLSKILRFKVVSFSLLRYVVFSHQFYLLLLIFGVEIHYETVMLLIFTMYFLATMLPVFSVFDFVIKGSVAIYLFSFLGVSEMIVMLVSTLMWFFNFVLPAVIGSFYVLSYKPNIKTNFVKEYYRKTS